ncbi:MULTISPECIES: response regulator transcription factor [unclassified Pseudactinotalea]|uniref:response regulator transcription factor n=1 Tax=unclassified Pseudactinotalea TaxID=2649176 RepID=UPI00128C7EF6|nr:MULTISPECIES: response regulator transcription factor [unclassified Pseudactinotalea]MPV48652.1 DNA-binding response regulator [Pseudactinotalea sp. HY160]QGH68623.1 DNA-binding response regulator [Pseudactinotalea sp. HY158]
MEIIQVWISAADPISRAGIISQLRVRPELRLLDTEERESADVAMIVTTSLDEPTLRRLRSAQRRGITKSVLVINQIDDGELVTAIEAGVVGVVHREDASADRLVEVIRIAAAGQGMVPPDLLGRLMSQVGQLQRQILEPRGLTFNGLAAREIEVLRLIADGYDTTEVAKTLSYSERTVKNVLHDVTSRLQLRNRSHAVAYALREGLI